MRSFIYSFAVAIVFVLLIISCTGPSGAITVSLDKAFTLSPGQSAHIQGENVSIRFIRVTADSRCPLNVQCIRAGDVTSEVEITSDGTVKILTIVQEGSGSEGAKTVYANFRIDTTVQPYPVYGSEILPQDYRMTFTIKKL